MNYATEFKKFATSHYIFSAVRITLVIVVPSIILAYFGILKEFYLFPLATSFIGITDQPGPFVRRRNALLLAIISFTFVGITARMLQDFPVLVYLEIIVFGFFFTMIGVYGQRLAAVGALSLVVMAIFIDGHLTGDNILKSTLLFLAGSVCYFLIFLVVSRIQPYKLAGQMIGENYLELSDYLSIKSNFYLKDPQYNQLQSQIIAQQIKIKNLQEETRETVFKTRKIVNESTTTSRLLMLMFLNSIDLHEKLMTSENDYRKVQKSFGETGLLQSVGNYLNLLAGELTNIGISLQSGSKAKAIRNFQKDLDKIFEEYFEIRNHNLTSETLENFMIMRVILLRIREITEEIKTIYKIDNQDLKSVKSLSTGLDLNKFVSSQPTLNFKVLLNNLSLKSSYFRHSIRVVLALLIAYAISQLKFLGIGHAYWILITVAAIMRPAYSATKSRSMPRLFGTIAGATLAYALLHFVAENTILFAVLLLSMILCFSFLKANYFWAVFFMTIYIFLTFNFLRPGNVDLIFKDRIIDTAIAGMVAFLVSYFVFPVWEHTQNLDLMKTSAASNIKYFQASMDCFKDKNLGVQEYKLRRKDAIIDLANLSDNFQRMISDPKNQRKKMELIHQFVNTAHLITAYIAAFSQYSKSLKSYPEIDFENWNKKISSELVRSSLLLDKKSLHPDIIVQSGLKPNDLVEKLMNERKLELAENEIADRRDTSKISHLTEIKNLQETLDLLYAVAREQRKGAEHLQA
jgi:uncharacterized membrane protein YccC